MRRNSLITNSLILTLTVFLHSIPLYNTSTYMCTCSLNFVNIDNDSPTLFVVGLCRIRDLDWMGSRTFVLLRGAWLWQVKASSQICVVDGHVWVVRISVFIKTNGSNPVPLCRVLQAPSLQFACCRCHREMSPRLYLSCVIIHITGFIITCSTASSAKHNWHQSKQRSLSSPLRWKRNSRCHLWCAEPS